jgi:hypothetical protein
MVLHLHAAHTRHLDVGDDAREIVRRARSQEIFG